MYEPAGIARTIEEIFEKCGHDTRLARRGPSVWEVRNGSANIFLSYYEPNGLIAGDAILCDLPRPISSLCNVPAPPKLRDGNAQFQCAGPEIVLSLVIFDRYLTLETRMKLFRYLFEKADYFDNVLVEQFGAGWKERD
ncbi:MAG: hypothetical protein IPM82_21830 [Saprospiraceae bacterium]|nr:hypothetical protein [Saprospiraceae bacterium]